MTTALIFTDVNGVSGFGRYAGAYRVATELRQAGYSVQVVEFLADLSLEQMQSIIDKYVSRETLFVGFATSLMIRRTTGSIGRLARSIENRYSGHLPHDDGYVAEVFAMIKRRSPSTKIVIGGARASTTSLEGVDFWVWGYAERSVLALAEHLRNEAPLTTRPGRFGQVISHDDYKYDGFEDAEIEWHPSDHVFRGEHLPIEIDRGCIFRCAFCAHPLMKQKGTYNRSRERLKRELVRNYETYGTTGYMFCDDTVNESLDKVQSLVDVFRQLPFQMEWTGFGRVDVTHRVPEQRELLLESGLKAMLVGLESFHKVAAKTVGKGLDPDLTKEAMYYLKDLWKDQVVITGSFIIGLPGESVDSIWQTAEWLQRPDCPVDEPIFSPLNLRARTDDPNSPISRLAREPAKYGYEMSDVRLGTGISTDGPYWKNEQMDKPTAEKLALELQAMFRKKQPVGNWAVYSRLRSLGYDHEQLRQLRGGDHEEFLRNADERKSALRTEYLDKLLA